MQTGVRAIVIGLMGLIGTLGCAWEPTIPTAEAPPVSGPRIVTGSQRPEIEPTRGQRAVGIAQTLIGTPYQWGGATPAGFDCSGLIHYVYRQLNTSLPRTAAAQRQIVRNIALRDAQPGDLLFFDLRTKSDHVALYLGANQFIHAPSQGKKVQRMTLDNPYFRARLTAVGQITAPSGNP